MRLGGAVPYSELIVSTQISICVYSSFSTRFLFHYFLPRIVIIILQSSVEKNEKLEDITSAVVKELTASCAECGISSDIIDEQFFACFPESPTHVTFRARLGGSSETDSGSLISLLESWVSGRATIIVTGVLMTVDAECSVAISSLSEGECSMTSLGSRPSPYVRVLIARRWANRSSGKAWDDSSRESRTVVGQYLVRAPWCM